MSTEIIKKILSNMDNISLNQNLIILIVCYIGVAFAAMNDLVCLCSITWMLFVASVISVLFSLTFYTIEYCVKKWRKTESYKK